METTSTSTLWPCPCEAINLPVTAIQDPVVTNFNVSSETVPSETTAWILWIVDPSFIAINATDEETLFVRTQPFTTMLCCVGAKRSISLICINDSGIINKKASIEAITLKITDKKPIYFIYL